MPETAACTIAGGAEPLALAKLKVVKLPAAWQASQAAVPKAMWFAGGTTSVGGAMLAKLLPAAWQLAQPLVMFAWFIVPTL